MAFVSGSSTAFGIFDSDAQFVRDADRLVKYVSVKLGGGLPGVDESLNGEPPPHVQVELTARDIYVSFEEAVVEYGAIVNAYNAKSSLAAWLGSQTGTLTGGESRYPNGSLEWARRQAQAFGQEAYVGGDATMYSGSITLEPGRQDYDLQDLLGLTGSNGLPRRMVVRQIYHYSPFASYRFFGTTSAVNYLNGQFNFQSFTPETVFYLMPVWEDILRGMQFETSNRVRRSNYSFEMHDNVLKLFPCPQQQNTLHFTYQLSDEMDALNDQDAASFGVSNISNIPFGNIEYSKINSVGRQWIWKMVLANSKETLGHKRRKLGNIPIPGGDLTLDGDAMVNDGRAEMEALRGELRALLDEMTYDKLAAKEAEQADALRRTLQGIPLKIYTGLILFTPFMHILMKWLHPFGVSSA